MWSTENERDFLQHHGILGMKWGVRRYQNEDGTLTELGKRRLSTGKKENRVPLTDDGRVASGYEREARSKIEENIADDYRNAEQAALGARQVSESGSRLARSSANKSRQKAISSLDLSNMSDRELQQVVNRMNLERSYKSLKASEISLGMDKAGEILATTTEIVTIGAGIARIAMAIHQMRR